MVVMFNVEVPVLVMVTVCGELTVPTVWFPKERLPGVTVTAVAAALPVPDRAMVWGLFAALSVMLIVPVAAPTAVGVKVTLIMHVPPPAAMVPTQSSDSAKLPVVVIAVMLSDAVPALITVTGSTELLTLRV